MNPLHNLLMIIGWLLLDFVEAQGRRIASHTVGLFPPCTPQGPHPYWPLHLSSLPLTPPLKILSALSNSAFIFSLQIFLIVTICRSSNVPLGLCSRIRTDLICLLSYGQLESTSAPQPTGSHTWGLAPQAKDFGLCLGDHV